MISAKFLRTTILKSVCERLLLSKVSKFVCRRCNTFYIGETTWHLTTRTKGHLEMDEKSHILAHLVNNENHKALTNKNSFEIIHSTSFTIRLKLRSNLYNLGKIIAR